MPAPPDVASMAAARKSDRNAPPTTSRDGFDLISRAAIVWNRCLPINPITQRPFSDILYSKSTQDLAARISFDRPEVLHAFRPTTIREIQQALEDATDDPQVSVVLFDSTLDPSVTPAFCAGGDQTVRSNDGGYQDGTEVAPKLRVLDLQVQMRRCPKPIMAVVRGYAIGGGHILHMVADLTLAATETAVFGQTGPRMGSFDAGYGSTQAAALMGPKRAAELWMLCRYYSAQKAVEMGLINAHYPAAELDGRVAQWVRRIVHNSPTALACCKAAVNAEQDGAAGIAVIGGELTRMYYKSAESQEGRQAFLEKRAPNFRSKL